MTYATESFQEPDTEHVRLDCPVEQHEQEPETPKSRWTVPALLRLGGAMVLLTSATTFLFQNWDMWTDVERYIAFLVYTMVLTATGFFCGIRLKETKSARTLLAVVGAIIPVHFSQLGALLYSCFGTPLAHYPKWLTWQTTDSVGALLTSGAGVLVLIPIALVVFTALARSHAKVLTAGIIVCSSVLLVPLRDPISMTLLGLMLLIANVMLDNYLSGFTACRTREGLMSRAMLGIPLLLIIARSLHLYQFSFLIGALGFATLGAFLFYLIPQRIEDDSKAATWQYLGTVPFGMSAIMLGLELVKTASLSPEYSAMAVHMPIPLTLFALSFFCRGERSMYRFSAAFTSVFCMLLQVMTIGGLGSATVAICVGLTVGTYAYAERYHLLSTGGVILFISGLISTIRYALEVFPLQPWMILAFIGLSAVILAACMESKSIQKQ